MNNEKVLLHAKWLVSVLPRYVRSDMENIVTLAGEQQAEIERLSSWVRTLEMAVALLTDRQSLGAADQRWAQQKAAELGYSNTVPVWQAAASDMMI